MSSAPSPTSRPPASYLTHERLDAYRAALEFLVIGDELAAILPRGRSYLSDQLRRAALSVVLNIAEGAGELAPAEKARFYRMARRSGMECGAILDSCLLLRLSDTRRTDAGKELLTRVVSMLTVLVRRCGTEREGTT